MRVVFMGSPAFAVPSLHLLVKGGFEVVGVVTRPDRPVGRGAIVSPTEIKRAALQSGLLVYQPLTLKSAEAVTWLRTLIPDAIVVVAFGLILPRSVLEIPPFGCINLHPSLLPKLRGAAPIQSAIRDGATETGVTIMLMNERMDAGPVLSQTRFPILPDDTALTLSDRLEVAGAEMLVDTLKRWERKEIAPSPQDNDAASYCTPLRKADADVDWSRSATEIARTCRAQTPWPGCQTIWDGRLIRLLAVEPRPLWSGPERPGTVFYLSSPASGASEIAVATGRGALVLGGLQRAGKKPLAAADFVRGQPRLVGATFESKHPSGQAAR